jgi:HEAT repeat protein
MKPASEKFLSDIRSSEVEVRYAAWTQANEMDPEVIPHLGKLLVDDQPGVRKAADEALKGMVHGVGKQPGGARRAAVVKELIVLTADGQVGWTRTIALRHLSLIGGDETVPSAAKLMGNVELQEEAVFCLERIPGKASTQALMSALPGVSDSFKPRILAALGHRRAEEATDLCAKAMESPNVELVMAALKSTARIGKKPSVSIKPPNYESLTGWQKVEYTDSTLRYADDQVRRGNIDDAIRYYRDFLSRPEEHLQCAAIIGLSKTGTAEAAGLIFPKLKSPNRTVRITAGKAWAAMAKAT